MIFQERLKLLRSKKGITQEKLAADLNIPSTTIRRLETVSSLPRRERLEMIADYFNVNIDYLLGRTDDPTPISIQVKTEQISSATTFNDADTTIALIIEQAHRMGLEPQDPKFQKLLQDALDLLWVARGENKE